MMSRREPCAQTGGGGGGGVAVYLLVTGQCNRTMFFFFFFVWFLRVLTSHYFSSLLQVPTMETGKSIRFRCLGKGRVKTR